MIDKDTNNVTLSEVLESLVAEAAIPRSDFPAGQPVLPIQFEIVSLWVRREPDEAARGLARILIQPPHGEPVPLGDQFPLDLTEHTRLRTRSQFNGFRADDPGRYWFYIEKQEGEGDWEPVARVPIEFQMTFPEPGISSS